MRLRTLVVLVVLAGCAGGWYWWRQRGPEESPYRTAKLDRGDVADLVTATGTLNPVKQVQIGSQVSGRIAEILVDYNSVVKEGQLVARIDPSPFEAQLAQAQAAVIRARAATRRTSAAVEVSRANSRIARAEIASAKADVNKARVNAENLQKTNARNSELARRKLISQSEVDQSETDLARARAEIDSFSARLLSAEAKAVAAESQIGQALADLEANRGEVAQAEASLQLATTNLSYTRITSPIRGIVISRNVDVGQTVAASFQAPVLFQIADDLGRMQIIANVDEADIGRTLEGQEVTFTVDAYPQRRFVGKVQQIRLAPIINQNVVTYQVVVDVANPKLLLKPGMTSNASILVARRDDVLRVPNAALAFVLPASKDEPAARMPAGPSTGLTSTSPAPRERERGSRQGGRRHRRHGSSAASGSSTETATTTGAASTGATTGPSDFTDGAEPNEGPRPGRVYVLRGQEPTPVDCVVGISDGSFTELVSGELHEGDELVVGASRDKQSEAGGSRPGGMQFRVGGRGPRI